jgi:hypothetical protein
VNKGSADPDWLHEIKYDGYCLRVEREFNAAPRQPNLVQNFGR